MVFTCRHSWSENHIYTNWRPRSTSSLLPPSLTTTLNPGWWTVCVDVFGPYHRPCWITTFNTLRRRQHYRQPKEWSFSTIPGDVSSGDPRQYRLRPSQPPTKKSSLSTPRRVTEVPDNFRSHLPRSLKDTSHTVPLGTIEGNTPTITITGEKQGSTEVCRINTVRGVTRSTPLRLLTLSPSRGLQIPSANKLNKKKRNSPWVLDLIRERH